MSGQWTESCSVTGERDTAVLSYTNARCLAVSGDMVHTVWSQFKNGAWGTSYRRSMDGGLNWEEAVAFSWNEATMRIHSPAVDVSGQDVHAVWFEGEEGERIVYYCRSRDGGATWSDKIPLTSASADCYVPSVAASGSSVHVCWTVADMMGRNISYRNSTDGGATWKDEKNIIASFFAEAPAIAISGSTVHITCYDSRWGFSEIVYRRSTDNGESWEDEQRITDWPKASTGMSIAAEGKDVHLVWHDFLSGYLNVYYKYSWNGGQSWGAEEQLTMLSVSPYGAGWPSVAVSGQQLHLVWRDFRNEKTEIYYIHSPDAGVTWSEEISVSADTLGAGSPFVAVSGSAVHVLWRSAGHIVRHRCNPTGNSGVSTAAVVPTTPGFALSQNYPNPFREQSSMRFTIPHVTHVQLSLHDMLGRQLRVIVDDVREAGNWIAHLDASQLPPGNYICRLQAGEVQLSRIVTVRR